ncbi:MAG: hypothetical protein ACRCW3_00160 [Metamycoplasmataceae bacterium]
MKESRIGTKGLWWDGQYGGAVKAGQFGMFYIKPGLEGDIGHFDELVCFEGDANRCYRISNGAKHQLDKNYVATINAAIDKMFPDAGGGGGGGGTGGNGVTNLRIDKNDGAIRFTDENGSAGRLPFADIKATPMEFYLDLSKPDASTHLDGDASIQVGKEYVIPFSHVTFQGRNNYITLDNGNHRVLIPEGGLRGQVRAYGAFRWSTSVKDNMSITVAWYARVQGSTSSWSLIYEGTESRTASQTTAALSWPTSSGYYDLPSGGPLELECRIKFNDIGTTNIDWGHLEILGGSSDGLKISLLKEPNYPYKNP